LQEGDEDENLMEMDQESDKNQEEEDTNPLMVPLDAGIKPTKEQLAEMWFSQDIFAESGAVGPAEKSDSDEERDEKIKPKTKTKSVNTSITSTEINDTTVLKKTPKEKDDFEIVPQEPPKSAHGSDSDTDSDSSSDDDDLDDDTKAEVLAYAKKMLRKKQREQILDDAYGKYMYDDEGLPIWFLEEEKRHRQPTKPVTKEEVEAMKAQFKEIDTRPSKKVAEAKARKKRVALKQLDKARKKADVISDQTDISELSKRKMIDRLYKKAAPKKPQKEYVVAKKGVRVRAGKGKVLVDPRMKKDKRASKAGANGKGKKGKGKGAKGGAAKGKGKGKGVRGGAPQGGKARGRGRK
jgi:AdoMet-dependent rRNA methyltransferase SPB1